MLEEETLRSQTTMAKSNMICNREREEEEDEKPRNQKIHHSPERSKYDVSKSAIYRNGPAAQCLGSTELTTP